MSDNLIIGKNIFPKIKVESLLSPGMASVILKKEELFCQDLTCIVFVPERMDLTHLSVIYKDDKDYIRKTGKEGEI